MRAYEVHLTCPDCGGPTVPVSEQIRGTSGSAICRCVAECSAFPHYEVTVSMRPALPFRVERLAEMVGGPELQNEWGPLRTLAVRLSAAWGVDEDAARQRVYRMAHGGLSAYEADQVATLVGFHPAQVWPEWSQYQDAQEARRREMSHRRAITTAREA